VADLCPHGLPQADCLICPRVPVAAARATMTEPGSRRIGLHLAGVIGGIVVIGLVAWVVAGLVFAVLHVVELIAVGAMAGWGGYRLGFFRGSHRRR
jgi:hypothetical protein